MFDFLKKLIGDYFQPSEPEIPRVKVSNNRTVGTNVDDSEKQKRTEPTISVKKVPEREPTEKIIKREHRSEKQQSIKPKTQTSYLIPFKQTVKKYHFASMGETDTHDKSLPKPSKMISGRPVLLKEIPFEITRNELMKVYLTLIDQCIRANKLHEISSEELPGHYLLLKSLAAVALNKSEKSQLIAFANHFSSYLKAKDLSIWNTANSYTKESEFPIVGWLKHQHQSQYSNFMDTFIVKNNSGMLTRDQFVFMQQFKDSPAFFLPNSIYMSWLTHAYEEDSHVKPMYNISKTTHYYHATITDNLLFRTQPKQVTFAPEHYYQKGKGSVNTEFRYTMKKSSLLRIQGRTLLFTDESGDLFAVKVQKRGEAKSKLTEEFQMADYLLNNQSRLDLQSHLPTPLGQYSVKRTAILDKCNTSSNYRQFLGLIADTEDLEVYVYKAPASYFTYLHNEHQSLSDFTASVKINVHDLFVLFKEGIIFPQLADIFHTHSGEDEREDKGRYQALVQLLSVFQSQLGRIDKWQKAVEFINLRASGIADLGDSLPITSLLSSSDFTRRYFPELLTGGYHKRFFDELSGSASTLYTGKRKLFGNYLYLNTMAEYLLVIQLALGSYGDKVTRKIDDVFMKEAVWQQLAELMFHCCAQAVTLMTGISQSRALALLNQRAKIENHVQQTQFWMTPDYSNMDDFEMRTKQYDLYPGESGYEVNNELIPGVGLSVDGVNQDLGGYNQELPLRELEKLLYATVTLIEGTMQLDKEFFKQMEQTEKLIESSDVDAEDCYEAAAKLLDMARPGCHFQKRLALSYYEEIKLKYPSSSKTVSEIGARFEPVKKDDAAMTIQRFWRSYKKSHEEEALFHDELMIQKKSPFL